MEKFGVEPLKSLDTFGVAGVLGRRGEVLYFPIFENQSVGRVSDLLIAQLKPTDLDQFLLRELINQSLQVAFSTQQNPGQLEEPIVFECGVDLEKIVFSFSFRLGPELSVQWDGLADRVFKGLIQTSFERSLSRIHSISHRMVFKYAPEFQLAELLVFIGLPGRIPSEVLHKRMPFDLIFLEAVIGKKYTAEEKYTQLGDFNQSKILEKTKRNNTSPPKRPQLKVANVNSWKWVQWLKNQISGVNEPESSSIDKVSDVELSSDHHELLNSLDEKSNRISKLESEIVFLKSERIKSSGSMSLESSSADFAVLKVQHQKLVKMLEELKTRNSELQAELSSRNERDH